MMNTYLSVTWKFWSVYRPERISGEILTIIRRDQIMSERTPMTCDFIY